MSTMKEYSHYYKKIPEGIHYIDVYRVLEMFEVSDPAISHAIKKLLVAGNRGHKDIEKDVREAIVSLNRRIEMWEEENQIQCLQHNMGNIDTFPPVYTTNKTTV